MGLLKLLAAPVWGPIDGLIWISKQVAEQVDNELYGEEPLQEELLRLAMSLDIDEITEEEYAEREEPLLARLKEIREHKAAMAGQ